MEGSMKGSMAVHVMRRITRTVRACRRATLAAAPVGRRRRRCAGRTREHAAVHGRQPLPHRSGFVIPPNKSFLLDKRVADRTWQTGRRGEVPVA